MGANVLKFLLQKAFLLVLYFSSPEFFCPPFRLFPAPTNCRWVSENVVMRVAWYFKADYRCFCGTNNNTHQSFSSSRCSKGDSSSSRISFAQWHYRSQWGSPEARLLLIENFSQYPARRLEIQPTLQFLTAWTRPTQGFKKKIKFNGNLFPIDKSEFPKLSWTTVHGCRAWFDDIPFSFKCTDIKTLFQSKKVICLGLLKLDYYSSCFLT